MILVVGGAGYIGSHVVKHLVQTAQVVVYDNLSTGHQEAVDPKAIFIEGDLADEQRLTQVFTLFPIEAVMHFASVSGVAESIRNPQRYYENNVASTLTLLSVMRKCQVKNLLFSSSAATYAPSEELLHEESLVAPTNPYGRSNYFVEQMLQDYAHAYQFNSIILRHFNVAGASADGELGESHIPETHLIPTVLQHLRGEIETIKLYGNTYPTEDGTCIRDYVHVEDLANAHILALEALLQREADFTIYNIGNELGFSVKEIIEQCEQVTGRSANIEMMHKRAGDVAILVASTKKIQRELGWQPENSLKQMIEHTWHWQKRAVY